MKPIPRKLLIHSAELKNAKRDRWQNETLTTGYMSETISDSNTAVDKQNAAIQAEIKDNKLKMLSTWRGARAFTWREVSKFTWREVSKNGGQNNES